MKIKKIDIGTTIGITIAIIIAPYVLMLIFGGFPIPRGNKVNKEYYTYYQNFFGIYYISVEYALNLFNHGRWGYLEDADKETFKVLSEDWAKDNHHVWYNDHLIENVDVKSFHINEYGVAVDKNRVYVRDFSVSTGNYFIRPSQSGIDAETAEYFVYRLGALQDEWMRDKDFVYLNDEKTDVDRSSFQIFDEDWFIDKDFLYTTRYNNKTRKQDLISIDSLQKPIEPGYLYFRNGKNIIYNNSIILKDIDVQRFEEIGAGKYRINNMLFLWGKPFLKDSLDVENARFYFYGHIAADNEHVYYIHRLLDDIDAATFRQVDDETFEDKRYIYTIKRGGKYPFEKKKK